jgi:2,4-dienoyl-CoA reductase-like NADH-dependent reductase (Old Yellow Enzyme family)
LAVQIAEEVRSIIPDSMPLFARISCDEYVEDGWNVENSVELSGWLKDCGVDLIDCSSGGNSVEQELSPFPGYQVPFSSEIRRQVGIQTGAVGLITEPFQAEQTLRNKESDVIFLGRELLRNPYWPVKARELLDNNRDLWPPQYERA